MMMMRKVMMMMVVVVVVMVVMMMININIEAQVLCRLYTTLGRDLDYYTGKKLACVTRSKI